MKFINPHKSGCFRQLALVIATALIGAPFAFAAEKAVGGNGQQLQAGVAVVDITPPVGFRMAGYFSERLATGTHDPLRAKALVLQQGETKIALVCCDIVEVPLSVSAPARQLAAKATGIPATNILVCATHSHTGPLFENVLARFFHKRAVARYGEDPHQTVDYPKILAERIAKAVEKANESFVSSKLEVGIAQQEGLSFNRRFHMKDGRVAFNPGQLNPDIVKPAGPIDPDVGILRVRDSRGRNTSAVLTVFAMHLDTLGGTEYSADYPFFLEREIRKAAGTNAVSLFAAGTCGDINHIDVTKKASLKGIELTEHIGTTLGRTVAGALEGLNMIDRPRLAVRSRTLTIPLQAVPPEKLEEARRKIEALEDSSTGFLAKVEAVKAIDLAAKGPTLPMEVQVFRIDDDTAIVGLPGEIFVELGLAIKAASPFKRTLVLSICNNRPGYVPTKKAFAEGSYEVVNSRVKPGSGELLVDAAVAMLNELKP